MTSSSLRLLFVGSGVSCAIPVIGHVGSNTTCCCTDAAQDLASPNRRNNVSLLISLSISPLDSSLIKAEESVVRVLIDAGKTFRNAYLRVMAPRRIRYVDALLVSHGHADAMNCVEDLCDIHTSTLEWANASSTALKPCVELIPMFLTEPTLREVQLVVSDTTLASTQHAISSRAIRDATVETKTPRSSRARLKPILLPEDRPLEIPLESVPSDFLLYSLPVEHGKNYISLGFVFGKGVGFKSQGGWKSPALAEHSCVVYISDLTRIPENSYAFLEDLMKIDVLVIDLLEMHGASSPAHTCWDDLWPIFHRLHPRKVYCVGMYCSVEHHFGNQTWAKELERERKATIAGLQTGKWKDLKEKAWRQHFLDMLESIELAYDGLELVLPP